MQGLCQLPGTLARPTPLRVPSVHGLARQPAAPTRSQRLNAPTRRSQPGCCKAVAEAARPPTNESRPRLQVPGEGLEQVW